MQGGKKRRIRLGRRIAALLDLPVESLTGEVKVTLYSDAALVAENHKGVFECTGERICLRTGNGMLIVEGKGMTLMELTDERALIEGSIAGARFENIK